MIKDDDHGGGGDGGDDGGGGNLAVNKVQCSPAQQTVGRHLSQFPSQI